MPELSSRVGLFTDSIIRRMTRISNKREGSINLSQGFPDFDPPRVMLDRLKELSAGGLMHQYGFTSGAPNFRRGLAKKYSPLYKRELDFENEICVTCGSTEAMMATVMTVCNPGDRIIVFSPFYENYGADSILSGAEPIYVPLVPPEFNFDRAVLEDAFEQNVKAIIVCNPSNPCGKVFTREELSFILSLAEKYDAFVITDEVYEHIVFDPCEHVYAASLPGAWGRVIVCNSLSKSYSCTGWRLGFVIGPEYVVEGVKKVHDFLTVGAAHPLQEAACPAFELGQDYYDALKAKYTKGRDIMCRGLDEMGIKHTVPQGAYFIMVDISDFLAREKFAGWTDLQFCEWMIQEIGVAAVPGSSFFKEPVNNYIRLHFARGEEVLKEAVGRFAGLQKYL